MGASRVTLCYVLEFLIKYPWVSLRSGYSFFLFFTILFESQNEEERERGRDLPSLGSLPPQMASVVEAGLGQS